MYLYGIMNYLLLAGGLAAAYYLYVSMKPSYPGYMGGGAHVSEDGEISTMPVY
jgi:hypothetical protein